MSNDPFKSDLHQKAVAAGFMDVRVTEAMVSPEASTAYAAWLDAGYNGEMAYLEKHRENRLQGVDHILPGAKSVLVFVCSYYSETQNMKEQSETEEEPVRIARYALGRDYHLEIRERLNGLVEWLEAQLPGNDWRVCVDSAPLLERAYAAAAGIGFVGKNGMIISWKAGSYTFLAEILTTAIIEPDEPKTGTCGNCTRCIDACPTSAIISPGVLDARRCISYLTIEKKSELSPDEAGSTGEWAFGCDICQDVCPYNKAPEETAVEAFRPGVVVRQFEPVTTFLEPESNRQFERRFHESPILRAGKRRMQKIVQGKLNGDQ